MFMLAQRLRSALVVRRDRAPPYKTLIVIALTIIMPNPAEIVVENLALRVGKNPAGRVVENLFRCAAMDARQ